MAKSTPPTDDLQWRFPDELFADVGEQIDLLLVGALPVAPALELDIARPSLLDVGAVVKPLSVGQVHPQPNFDLGVK